MTPRRVIVLRHGETTANRAGIWQGHLDSPLTPEGEAQAIAAARALVALRPDRVVTSDLARAARTAEAVARASGIPIEADQRWREIDVGRWQGLTNAEVGERYPVERAAVLAGEDIPRGIDGESLGMVAARVGEAMTELVDSMAPGECVVVSTHGAAGRVAAACLLGLDQQQAWRLLEGFGNCHWAELVQGRSGWRVRTWNVCA